MKRISLYTFIFGIMMVMAVGIASANTVTGSIQFTGTAPEAQKINMDADPVCSAFHSDAVYTQDVVVNDNGTLKNVFIYVKRGLEDKSFDTPKDPVVLDQQGCRYNPHVFGIQVGQTLQIVNSDATLHNVHGMPTQSKEFNLGMPIKGMKLKRKFDNAEVMVKVKCDVHPWMNAYVGVLPHPFYSVSGDDGSFEIKDLPAGTYTLEAWHEKYGTMTQEVTVADGGSQAVDFSFQG